LVSVCFSSGDLWEYYSVTHHGFRECEILVPIDGLIQFPNKRWLNFEDKWNFTNCIVNNESMFKDTNWITNSYEITYICNEKKYTSSRLRPINTELEISNTICSVQKIQEYPTIYY